MDHAPCYIKNGAEFLHNKLIYSTELIYEAVELVTQNLLFGWIYVVCNVTFTLECMYLVTDKLRWDWFFLDKGNL